MARFPDSELERLKATTDLAVLVRGVGVELQAHGEDLLGLCPFHDDHEPSLVVSPKKGLWNCLGACRAGGSAIDWVMKANQLTFREAVVHLQDGASSATQPAAKERSRAPLSLAARPSNPDLLSRVVAIYRESYRASADAKSYTTARGIGSEEAAERFAYGYADGSLLAKLGREHLSELVRLGLVNARTNRELLAGCLVLPIVDASGKVLNLYGRRLVDTAGSPRHLYLPGPRRGVFNPEALKSSTDLILCEALIDALTFWCHGFHNVTASYGVNGFTEDLRRAIVAASPKRLLLAYDRDAAGDAAAADLGKKLGQAGIGCYRVLFPKGMDANSYSLHVAPPEKSLALVLQSAEWMAGPQAVADREHPKLDVSLPEAKAAAKERSEEPASVSSLAALQCVPETTSAAGVDPLDLVLGERRWKVRGLLKNLSYEKLQVLVRVEAADRVFVDAVDLVSSRQRKAYVHQAAVELGLEEEIVRKDLGKIHLALEPLQDELIRKELSPKAPGAGGGAGGGARSAGFLAPSGPGRGHPRRLRPLRHRRRARQQAPRVSRGGVAQARPAARGDRAVELGGREVGAPRGDPGARAGGRAGLLLGDDRPVALLHGRDRSRAQGAGDRRGRGRGTRQLRPEAPAERRRADHRLDRQRPAQRQARDPRVPRARAGGHPPDDDGDRRRRGALNRCLVLTVDEDREQTRAIHVRQREGETLEGLLAERERRRIVERHKNAQRLLKPLLVVNPYARQLTFLDDRTRTRRDHVKYLTLIRTIALLHQHQRPRKTTLDGNDLVEYIEVDLSDIATANRLAHDVLGRSLDELPPQTRLLLDRLHAWVTTECERHAMDRPDFLFSRRQVREALGWSDFQVKTHLARLEEASSTSSRTRAAAARASFTSWSTTAKVATAAASCRACSTSSA